MKHLKTFESYNQDMLSKSYQDPVVGDEVYINYEIPGGNGEHVPTPVKIKSIKGSGKQRAYIVSHNVELSQFKNAPDQAIKRSDIIGLYKGVNTPVGPGWSSQKPSTPTYGNERPGDVGPVPTGSLQNVVGSTQVSNDMYL